MKNRKEERYCSPAIILGGILGGGGVRSLVERVTYGLKLDNVYSIVPASKRTERFEGGRQSLSFLYVWSPLPSCAVMRGTVRNKKVARPEMVLGTLPPPRLGSRHAGLITREKRVYLTMCSRDFRDPIVDVTYIVSRCASFDPPAKLLFFFFIIL